ncbi:hypothetical protein GCM10028808_45730 [Spirosoma migulaei]
MITKDKNPKKNPLISIIVPCYNSSATLAETLQSIVIQTYSHWECIIIDDHSKDNSQSIIQEYSEAYPQKIKKYVNHKKGACSARNYGVQLSKGDYIKFLDSDDVLFDNSILENQIKFITDDNIDIVHGKEYYFENTLEENNIIKTRGGEISKQKPETFFKYFPITSSFMISKRVLSHIRWNENLQSGQEFFLLFQCYIRGYSFYYQDIPVAKIRTTNSKYRISNKDPKVYANQTAVLVNEMYKDLETLQNIDPKFIEAFYKKILSFSYKAVSQKNISAAKKIRKILFRFKTPIVSDKYLNILYKLNNSSFLIGFLFYRIVSKQKGNILF